MDIIDLTGDLSDLKIPPRSKVSSAKKRPLHKAHPSPPVVSSRRELTNHHGLIGESFAVQGRDRYYTSVRYKGMKIEVDSMITTMAQRSDEKRPSRQRALVRRIVYRKPDILVNPLAKSEILCHVQWLRESTCGSENELFLRDGACHDLKLCLIRSAESIYIGKRGPIVDRSLLRHVFQHSYNVWRDAVLIDNTGHPVCDSCCSSAASSEHDYHLCDFVLVEEKTVDPSKVTCLLWRVARIVQLDGKTATVQLLERFSDRVRVQHKETYVSERRLLLTSQQRQIPLTALLSHATVSHDPNALAPPTYTPTFFCQERIREDGEIVLLSRPLPSCRTCSRSTSELEDSYRRFMRQVELPAVDYYSGGGGGMIGGRSFFDHKHAVEMNLIACQTLEYNFQNTTVHCQTVIEASRAARQEDVTRSPERDHVLPCPGSIVLATAGPPCQGHSGANHQNKVDDSRNDELFVTINEIHRLKPDIFILENVPGMKRNRENENDNENEEARNFAVEGIKGLRNIGYQVRVVQLDSRSFGSPQNRTRLFLVCARKGVLLPSIPVPTHVNAELKKNIFDVGHKSSRDFYVGNKGDYGSAPLPTVTVRDALSDLPRFEYRYGDNRPIGQMRRFDPRKEIGSRVGFLIPEPYDCPAKNDFQAKQRDPKGVVENQYTPTWTQRVLDIIFTSDAYVGQSQASDLPGNCRRINSDRGASTLLTSSAPGGKYTGPIHYDQRRTLTVAERKRIQGVPDDYHLCGRVEDKDKQVGNMINVDLSRALHSHIHREVFFSAWREMGEPENFLERWREAHPIE